MDLVKEGNTYKDLKFATKDDERLNTKDFYFTPSLSSRNGKEELSLKAEISKNQYIEFIYSINVATYLVDFSIRSVGISSLLDLSDPLKWIGKLQLLGIQKVLIMKIATRS